jgi:hypothetical protein
MERPRFLPSCVSPTAVVLLSGLAAAAGSFVDAPAALSAQTEVPLAALWVEPTAERDLFHGPGGPALAPDPAARYRVVAVKVGGFSDGYDVVDPDGREWSAKFPPEAAPEVVASRIHWGLGYHQPPIYFVREWHADGASAPNPQLPARFREEEPAFHGLEEGKSWDLADNPFVGTRELAGLLVLQAMLGNSDLKTSNTSMYELDEPVHGVQRWYALRDIGHSLGRTGVFESPRGDIEAFEATGFIRRVDGARVELEYGGRHRHLFDSITIADVRWICERLDRLTDSQWRNAFRAGGYDPTLAGRFIRKLKDKIAEGLALPAATDGGA